MSFAPIWQTELISAETLSAAADSREVICTHSSLGIVGSDLVRFEIPTFQRGLRWNSNKRDEFLKSLRAGLPIGTLVLAKKEDSQTNGMTVRNWYVLDGQQRTTSLRLLISSFWKEGRFSFEGVLGNVDSLARQFLTDDNESRDLIQGEIAAVLKNVSGSADEILNNPQKFLRQLVTQMRADYPNEDRDVEDRLIADCSRICQNLRDQFESLAKYPVSVLLVTPPPHLRKEEQRSILTEIFTALNSYIKLTKYEELAAKWINSTVVWPPTEVSPHLQSWLRQRMEERISDTYERVKEDYEYDPNIEPLTDEYISLFDVLEALSQSTAFIVKPAPRMRQSQTPSTDPRRVFSFGEGPSAQIAFDVMSLFLQKKRPANMDELPNKFPHGDLNKLVVGKSINAYTDVLGVIEGALTQVVKQGTYENKKPLGLIQAVVYISNLLALKYGDDFSEVQRQVQVANENDISTKQAVKRWKSNLPIWWFKDSISDDFQGSDANTNAVRRVWTTTDVATTACVEMLTVPSLKEIMNLLVNAFVKESPRLERAPKQRSQSDQARALMFAAHKGSEFAAAMEADHVIPFKARRGSETRLSAALPLNHIANWMPLEKSENIARANTPWSEHIGTVSSAPRREVLKKRLLLPAENFERAAAFTIEAFLSVMLRRFQLLVDQSLINLGLEEYRSLPKDQRSVILGRDIRDEILEALFSTSGFDLSNEQTEVKIAWLAATDAS